MKKALASQRLTRVIVPRTGFEYVFPHVLIRLNAPPFDLNGDFRINKQNDKVTEYKVFITYLLPMNTKPDTEYYENFYKLCLENSEEK